MNICADLMVLLPELILAIGAMGLLLAGAISAGASRSDNQVSAGEKIAPLISWGGIALLVAAGVAVLLGPEQATAFNNAFVADGFSRFAKLLILLGAGLSILLAEEYFARLNLSRFELPVLMVLASLGMMLMVSAGDATAVGANLDRLGLGHWQIGKVVKAGAAERLKIG